MKWVPLEEAGRLGLTSCGAKALRLAQAAALGLRVAPGVVLPVGELEGALTESSAFAQLLEQPAPTDGAGRKQLRLQLQAGQQGVGFSKDVSSSSILGPLRIAVS